MDAPAVAFLPLQPQQGRACGIQDSKVFRVMVSGGAWEPGGDTFPTICLDLLPVPGVRGGAALVYQSFSIFFQNAHLLTRDTLAAASYQVDFFGARP